MLGSPELIAEGLNRGNKRFGGEYLDRGAILFLNDPKTFHRRIGSSLRGGCRLREKPGSGKQQHYQPAKAKIDKSFDRSPAFAEHPADAPPSAASTQNVKIWT